MAETDRLDRAEFAALAGYGRPGTVTRLLYRARARRTELRAAGNFGAMTDPGLFPEPDGYLGRTPYWLRSTVEAYLSHRTPLGGGGWLPGPAPEDEEAEAGPGDCPICGHHFNSVSSHRRRKASCSYDPAIRDAALVQAATG